MTQLDLDGMTQVMGSDGVVWGLTAKGWKHVTDGKALQESGIADALAAERVEWREHTIELLVSFAHCAQRPFSMDEFRQGWTDLGYSEPHHPNVWGAVTQVAAKRKLIKSTGQWVQSKRPAAHARYCQLWEAA